MGRTKTTKEPSPLVKTGYNITPDAKELNCSMSDLLKVDQSVLVEVGLRAVYDSLPASHREALSTILRAKGHSLRNLRKLSNQAGEGERSSESPLIDRQADIDRIGRNSVLPVDVAIETFRN